MLVGKRGSGGGGGGGGGGGSFLRRTSSLSGGMNIELSDTETQETCDPMIMPPQQEQRSSMVVMSPRNSNNSAMETPHFLRTCRLCNSRLIPGRDIYMYRGDTAFCSLECREEKMKKDERKEKWKNHIKVNSKKQQQESPPPPPPSSTKTHTTLAAA